MNKTIEYQLAEETTKLNKLEKQAHQWINQANPSLDNLDKIRLHMNRLLDTTKDKAQLLGPNMSNILDLSIQQKMSNLSSVTTLTIDIQKALYNWTKFQHQLAVTAEAIVEICIQKQPSIRQHSP